MRCPCDTGKDYEACCGRYHAGQKVPTAVALMRSRYSAFALGLDDYLLDTWHPSTRPVDVGEPLQWTGLTMEETVDGKAWDDEGIVQFEARCTDGVSSGAIRERSRFVVEDGRWLYVDGVGLD